MLKAFLLTIPAQLADPQASWAGFFLLVKSYLITGPFAAIALQSHSRKAIFACLLVDKKYSPCYTISSLSMSLSFKVKSFFLPSISAQLADPQASQAGWFFLCKVFTLLTLHQSLTSFGILYSN